MQIASTYMPAPTTQIVNVRVLLFASYADRLGLDSLRVALPAVATVGDALDHVRSLPGGDQIPPKPLCAVNLAHADLETRLTEGDELALLPPLAGG
jgi:molybdopterin converting factor small subunit